VKDDDDVGHGNDPPLANHKILLEGGKKKRTGKEKK